MSVFGCILLFRIIHSNVTIAHHVIHTHTLSRAGIIGYITNVLALEMTFRPLEFIGYECFRVKDQPWGLFGFQVRMFVYTYILSCC